jgi:hypothetical protein
MMRIHISPIYTLLFLLPSIACIDDEASLDELRAGAAFEDELDIASDPGDPLAAIPVDPCRRSYSIIPPECIPDEDPPEDPGTAPKPPRARPEPEPEPEPKPPRAPTPPPTTAPPRPITDPGYEPGLVRRPSVPVTPCEIETVDPIVLWPPSHELQAFSISDCVVALTGCGLDGLDINFDKALEIVSLSSDEHENGKGDGHTCGDIALTSPSSFEVRSERTGGGDGRVYTIGLRYTDAWQQHSYASCQVVVPSSASVTAVDSGCQLCLDAGVEPLACDGCAYDFHDC